MSIWFHAGQAQGVFYLYLSFRGCSVLNPLTLLGENVADCEGGIFNFAMGTGHHKTEYAGSMLLNRIKRSTISFSSKSLIHCTSCSGHPMFSKITMVAAGVCHSAVQQWNLIILSYKRMVIWWDDMRWLSHWGWVMLTCICKLTSIGSDNGLSPGWRQAIIWTNAAILLIEPLGTNFSEILIEMQTFSLKKIRLKMSSAAILSRSRYVKCSISIPNLPVVTDTMSGTDGLCLSHQKWNFYILFV